MRIVLRGRQIKGDGIGSKQVFPTINLRIPGDGLSMETGVYAAYCKIDTEKYKAALHYGARPTFNKNQKTLELYVLSDKLKPYDEGQEILVEVIEKIRPTKAFKTPSELKMQINEDIININKILDVESK